MRCSKIASVKVSEITELISKALENDKKARWAVTSHCRTSVSNCTTVLSSEDKWELCILTFSRKAGGRCGFAESMPQGRITALKMDETPVEMTDVTDRANDIVQKAEAPPQTYPLLSLNGSGVHWDNVSLSLFSHLSLCHITSTEAPWPNVPGCRPRWCPSQVWVRWGRGCRTPGD